MIIWGIKMDKIITLILGIVFVVISVFNFLGNINMLHSYHRKRVKPEDVKPMAKWVGVGSLVIGLALIASSILTFLAYEDLSGIVMGAGLSVGIAIELFAIIKYNKGLF